MSKIIVRQDLRSRFGPARDQGARATCLAFAMSDTHAAMRRGAWHALSCEYLFYRAKRRDGTPVDEGTTISAARAALLQDGQPLEMGWPYLAALPADETKWKPPAGIETLYRRSSQTGHTCVQQSLGLGRSEPTQRSRHDCIDRILPAQ